MKPVRVAVFSFAVAAMCFSTTSLLAQRGGGMMRMMGGGGGMELDSSLLAIDEVQAELEFTDEQKEAIGARASELVSNLRSEMREIFSGGGDQSEMAELMDELREEEKEFVGLLTDEQKNRFQQLRYQRMGNAIYRKEEVQKAVGLSDESKQAIEDAFTSSEEEMQAAIAEARESGEFGTIRDTMDALQKKLVDTLDESLTDEQKAKVEEMKGEAFEFPQRQRRQRRNRSDF